MIAWVFIRSIDGTPGSGNVAGDIIEILPPGHCGKRDIDKHLIIAMELDIPCGAEFESRQFNCARCRFNDWETCEKTKLLRAVWDAGTLFEQPKPLTKNRYNIDYTKFISSESLPLVLKGYKDSEEINTMITRTNKNPQYKTIIIDKALK